MTTADAAAATATTTSEKRGTTEIMTERGVFSWEIIKFNFHNKTPGSALRSPSFSVDSQNDYVWHLLFYPRGENKENYYVKLKLVLERGRRLPVSAQVSGAILNPPGKDLSISKFMYSFDRVDENASLSCCLRPDKLYNYIKWDKLSMTIEIAIGTNIRNTPPLFEKAPLDFNLDLLSRDFQELLDSKKLSDFTLLANGKKYPVHKAVLAARSAVFAAAFENNMRERKKSTMEIKEVDSDAMTEFLRFIYTGKVRNLNELAHELLDLADKYRLEDLKEICSETLCKSINEDNAVDFLITAESHAMHSLKSKVIEFIAGQIRTFVELEKFKSLQESPKYSHLYLEILRTFG